MEWTVLGAAPAWELPCWARLAAWWPHLRAPEAGPAWASCWPRLGDSALGAAVKHPGLEPVRWGLFPTHAISLPSQGPALERGHLRPGGSGPPPAGGLSRPVGPGAGDGWGRRDWSRWRLSTGPDTSTWAAGEAGLEHRQGCLPEWVVCPVIVLGDPVSGWAQGWGAVGAAHRLDELCPPIPKQSMLGAT